jgi:hypothetical protein
MWLARLQKAALIPVVVFRFWKAMKAWEQHDWGLMISLIRPNEETGLDSNSDYILLAIAYSRLGRFTEAPFYFERVVRHQLYAFHQPLFFYEFAYALYRNGEA